MTAVAFEAMQLTSQLNKSYHDLGEIQALFAKIIGKPVDENCALFPPFCTDFGENITVGNGVFINSGCRFQEQCGIRIGACSLIGTMPCWRP